MTRDTATRMTRDTAADPDTGSRRRARARRALVALAALPLALAAAGCAGLPADVQPWQKGDLARPEMRFDANLLETRYGAQIYTSREASSGGLGVGGGGCGCN
jgi:hypothetical protein